MTHPFPADLSTPSAQSLVPGSELHAQEQQIRQELARVADRVERLLVRHDQLRRSNALLSQQLRDITAERDSLRSRLSAARARVEALIARLPDNIAHTSHTQPGALG